MVSAVEQPGRSSASTPSNFSPTSKDRLVCDVMSSSESRANEMSGWIEALRKLLDRTATVEDLVSLNTFIDIRTQIRDEIYCRVSTKEEELNAIIAARDAEILRLKEELDAQRQTFTKQIENEKQRSAEALELADSKYTELKNFVDVLRRCNTEAAERMCRELQIVREKAIEETELRERSEADERIREQKVIIERLRMRLHQQETESSEERERHRKELAHATERHEAWVNDMEESAHEILASRLRDAEMSATARITMHESQIQELQQDLEQTKVLHEEAYSELEDRSQEKERKWIEALSKVKHLKCVQESFQEVIPKRSRRSVSTSADSPKSIGTVQFRASVLRT